MAKFYSKERSKYGNLTGQIIIWPVEYTGDPNDAVNRKNLPAGYLKCDGTKYQAEDYPQLAAILGTGSTTTFIRKNMDGSNFDNVADSQFMVPDFGSKYPEPTSGANAGVYNDIRKKNINDQEKSRSGIGIEATVTQGTNNVIPITYSGKIAVPSQEIPIPGKPSYNYASATHYTESATVEDTAIHGHLHSHQAVKTRVMTKTSSETNDQTYTTGYTGRWTATTVNIDDWLDKTRFNNAASEDNTDASTGNPDGSGQGTCKAIKRWNPSSGFNGSGTPVSHNHPFNDTVYFGGCVYGYGENDYTYGCILNKTTKFNGRYTWGSPNGVATTQFMQTFNATPLWFICCSFCGQQDTPIDHSYDQAPTYVAGAQYVPLDWNGASLADVLPLNNNDETTTRRSSVALYQEETETNNLVQTTDPTAHTHRVRLEPDSSVNGGNHSYKVKTRALELDPELLSSQITIGADASHSVDSASSPYIIMEYLIKI